jgi:hypothetical protein
MMLEYTRNLVLYAFALVHSPSSRAWDSELHDTSMPPVLGLLILALLAVLVDKTLRVLVSIIVVFFRVSVRFCATFVVRVIISR